VFKVNDGDVAKLGQLMDRAGSAATLFAGYNRGSGPNELGEGLLGMLAAPLDRWQALAEANTSKAANLGTACGKELRATAAFYRTTDTAAETRMDAGYPYAASRKLLPGEVVAPDGAGDFSDWEDAAADPRDPSRKYAGPPPPTEPLDGWPVGIEELLDRLSGLSSVAGHVRDFVVKVAGGDPFNVIVTLVSGDWKLLMTQGMTFEDTAVAFERIKQNVARGSYAIQDSWEGNAASAAENWLADYYYAAGAHATFSRDAGWRIKNFATSAYHAFVALNIAVDALLDAVFDALLIGAGPVVGGVISIFRGENPLLAIASVLGAYKHVTDAIDVLLALAHTVQSVAEMVAGNGEIAAQSWPGEPYDHPGAQR
jgi:uncharacterized protein YukE